MEALVILTEMNEGTISIQELMAFISIFYTRATTLSVSSVFDAWSELFLVPRIQSKIPCNCYQTVMRR